MDIRYDHDPVIDADRLRELFCSVHWDFGNHPEALARAVANSAPTT